MDWEPSSEAIEVLLPAYFDPWFKAMQPLPQAVRRHCNCFVKPVLRIAAIANVLYGEDLLLERLRTLGLAPLLDAVVFSTELGWLKAPSSSLPSGRATPGALASDAGNGWRRLGD